MYTKREQTSFQNLVLRVRDPITVAPEIPWQDAAATPQTYLSPYSGYRAWWGYNCRNRLVSIVNKSCAETRNVKIDIRVGH